MEFRSVVQESAAVPPGLGYFHALRREMLPFIPPHARDFLDLGCGAGFFGALLRDEIKGAHVTGVEMHPGAAAEARKRLDLVFEGSVEAVLDAIPRSSVDCVVCNDVLEHLVDPWTVLRRLRTILRPGGSVVSSIPNVRHFPVFKAYFLAGEWEYEEDGVLDRTHLRFFTKSSIQQMFRETGFHVDRIEGIHGYRLPWKAAILNCLLRGRLDDMKYQRFASVAMPVVSVEASSTPRKKINCAEQGCDCG